jgi:hypothetical protein
MAVRRKVGVGPLRGLDRSLRDQGWTTEMRKTGVGPVGGQDTGDVERFLGDRGEMTERRKAWAGTTGGPDSGHWTDTFGTEGRKAVADPVERVPKRAAEAGFQKTECYSPFLHMNLHKNTALSSQIKSP